MNGVRDKESEIKPQQKATSSSQTQHSDASVTDKNNSSPGRIVQLKLIWFLLTTVTIVLYFHDV